MLLPTAIKAAAFLLSPPVAAAVSRSVSHPTPDSYATPKDTSVITWRNERKAFARFHIPCHGCTSIGAEDDLVFELSTGTTNKECVPGDIILNGNGLTQSWDGDSGSGSGVITAESLNVPGSQDLHASWQSLCIPPSSESATEEDDSALLLTVQIHQIDADEAEQEAGFTVSFKQLGAPEILRLDTSPLPIAGDDPALDVESWRDPKPSDRLRVQMVASPDAEGSSLDEAFLQAEIEEFQELQFRAQTLQKLITAKENKIRKLLQEDCRSISSQVQECDSVGCFFQTCFSAFPELISRLRCRFGSLDSCLSRKPSLGCGGQDDGSENEAMGGTGETSYPLGDTHGYNASHSMGNQADPYHDPSVATNEDPSYASASPSNAGASYPDNYFRFNRGHFVLFVVVILTYCLFRRCVRACRSPRRRAEHAARREERRNRIAYRCAARRHRWSQWWNGRQPRTHESSSHHRSGLDLESGRNETARRDSTSDTSSIFEEGAMQAEILGLRRALEFVGDLVRPEDPEYYNLPRRYDRHVYDRAGSPSTRPASIAPPASSTAMLTTISSPRTSSLMSCDDTGSSVTLETLETDPPEYRK